MDVPVTVLKILISFMGIWIGSNLILYSVNKLAHKIHKSSFLISFLLLGALTSISEISVAINSYIDQELEISVGNLLGGIIVLFLFLIPLLAVIAGNVRVDHKISKVGLIVSLIALLLPSLFMIDSHLQLRESIILIAAYIVSSVFVIKCNTNNTQKKVIKSKAKIKPFKYIFTIILVFIGAAILFIACDVMIGQIMQVADYFKFSPFIISLIGLSLGTNLPEISLAIKSLLANKKDVAFGNYLGSAVFNIFILGVLGIVNNRITVDANFYKVSAFSGVGLLLFYLFTRSKQDISRKEGFVLLLIYVIFLVTEICFNGLT